MKLILRIARTELATLFYSPIAWFILIVFSFLTGMRFAEMIGDSISTFDLEPNYYKDYEASISEVLFNGDYGFWNTITQNLYIYLPLLTMGLMSREYSSGSIKLLYSSPVTDSQIVFGKFLAAITFGAMLLIVPIISYLVAGLYIPFFDWMGIFPGLLGLYLLICAYCAIGLFMSSLTSYQVVAAIGTLIVFTLLNFVGTVGQEYDFIREITYWLSINGRTNELLAGLIRSEEVIYFGVVIALFLIFTILRIRFSRTTVAKSKVVFSYLGVICGALLIGYVTSRPSMICFHDCTRTKTQTLTQASQNIMEQLTGKLTVTNYVNLLDNQSFQYLPQNVKNNEVIFKDFKRFKPDMQINYVFYYNNCPSTNGEEKTLEEQRDYMAMVFNQNLRLFKSPEELAKIADLSSEQFNFVRIVERENGQTTFLRDFSDMMRIPSEAEIAAAFKKMISTESPQVAFLKGNGEREITRPGDRDYTNFSIERYSRAALVNQGFEVVEVDFSTNATIPDAVNIVVISDLQRSFSPAEYEQIDRYIARGGNLMILCDAGRQEQMNPLIERFGVHLEPGILAQPFADFYPDLLLAKVAEQAAELSTGFQKEAKRKQSRVSMPGCVALSPIAQTEFTLIPVLTTQDKGAWIERETKNLQEDQVVLNPQADEMEQTYVTAYAATRTVGEKSQRILILGDADCMSNAELTINREGYSSWNFNLILESFRWLSNGEYPIDISRPAPIDYKHNLKTDSINWIKIGFMAFIPIAMVLIGLTLWFVRRRK